MSELKRSYFLVIRREYTSPHVYFGPFDGYQEAEAFVDRFLRGAGLISAFVPEQFEGLHELPSEVWGP